MRDVSRAKAFRAALLAAPVLTVIAACGAENTGDPQAYLRSAQTLLQNNDLRGAEIQLRNAARAAPNDVDIRMQLVRLYLKANNPAAAEAQLITAGQRGADPDVLAPALAEALYAQGKLGDLLKEIQPANRPSQVESTVRLYRGLAELSLGNTEAAGQLLAEAERLDPEAAGPKLALSQRFLGTGDVDAAEAKVDEALALDLTNDRVLDQKARVLGTRGNRQEALQYFDRAVGQNPYNVQALLGRANLKLLDGDLDGALKEVQTAQGIAPGSAMASYLMAEIAVRKGNFKDADVVLNRLRPLMDRMPTAYFLAGTVKYELDQLDQAADYLERYVARQPEVAKPHMILGAIALRRGDANRAIEALEQASKLAPDDPAVQSLLSQAYFAQGDTSQSLSLLNAAVNKQPTNATLRTELALSRFRSGDGDAAVAELTMLFDAGSGSIAAGPPLVATALRTGHIDDAAAAAEALVRTDPENTLYQGLLGSVRIAQRDYPAAERIFAALVQKDPALAPARNNLAEVYWTTKRPAEAKRLFQTRLTQDPADVGAMQSLALLNGRERNYDEALRLLTQAQQTAAADPTPGMQIVALYAEQKKWPEAIRQARVLSTTFPRDARVIDVVGRAYWQSGDATNAAMVYRQGLEVFPTSALLQTNYAAVLFAMKDDDAGLAALQKAVQLAPTTQELKSQLVQQTYRAKGAEAALTTARSLQTPNDPTGDLLVADILDASGQYPAAMTLLQRRQAESPAQIVLLKIVEIQRRHKEHAAGVALLEAWLRDHAEDVAPRVALAQLYGEMRNYDAAIRHFERLLVERSSDPIILNDLAWNYLQKNDPRARATAEKAYRAAPQLAHVADTLGWILTVQGDAVNGIKYLQPASQGLPNMPDVQYHYAVALNRTNKPNEARAVLQKILALNTEFEGKADATQLLARLGPAPARP